MTGQFQVALSFAGEQRNYVERVARWLQKRSIAVFYDGFEEVSLRLLQRLSWKQLYRQFGAHPAKASHHRTVQNFRSEVLRELKKIKIAPPDLNYSTAPGVLILLPSTPVIAPLNQVQLGR